MWTLFKATAGRDPSSLLFLNAFGSPLGYTAFHDMIRACCARIGLDYARYGTHSLRSGAATTLRCVGVSWKVIRIIGRWKLDSAILYTQMNPSELTDMAAVSPVHDRRHFSLSL